jgi:hypothetical protein
MVGRNAFIFLIKFSREKTLSIYVLQKKVGGREKLFASL